MDNIKALVERLTKRCDAMERDGWNMSDIREAIAALAPLAEPVEMPEEPPRKSAQGWELNCPWWYADKLRSALKRALADATHVRQANANYREENRLATARAEASERDAKLLNEFEKSRQTVYYTTNDWRGVKESGWAYWEVFGPEGPQLYPDIRSAMQAALDAAGRSGG